MEPAENKTDKNLCFQGADTPVGKTIKETGKLFGMGDNMCSGEKYSDKWGGI